MSTYTTGKPIVAECLGLCRVPGHSAKIWFAKCQAADTQQEFGTRHARALPSAGRRQIKALGNVSPLPSAGRAALGKARARAQHARPPCAARQGADGVNSLPSASSWHSAKVKYCRVSPAGTRQSRNVAECAGVALGKVSFAEYWCPGTRQTWLKKNLVLQIFLVST